jgi:hypothetical protein
MKKLLLLLIVGCFLCQSFYALADDRENNSLITTLEDTLTVSPPDVKETGMYVTVSLQEQTSCIQMPGHPALPRVTRVFTLPLGSTVLDVMVDFSDSKTLSLSQDIQPAPQRLFLSNYDNYRGVYTKDESIYGSPDSYPFHRFEYTTGAGLQDKDHVMFLTVHCYPVWYSPKENILGYSTTLHVTVRYQEPQQPRETSTQTDSYDLVIIAPEAFHDDLQPLINHKIAHGLQTMFQSVEDIYASNQGRDHQEQIKEFIKYAVDNWDTAYVLLCGDINTVPIRETTMSTWGGLSLPTDLYYADIYDSQGNFASWDTNHNNIFGEYTRDGGAIDQVDLYPDVMVGRLPCSSSREVQQLVDKIITYETQTYGKEWFQRLILLGGDTFPGHGVYEGEVVTEQIGLEMAQFQPVTLWTSTGSYNPLTINQEITKGAGFLSYSGHGYEQGFGTSPPNIDQRIEYYTPFLLGQRNGDKLPIVFFDACLTSSIDFTLANLDDWLPLPLISILDNLGLDTSRLFPCFAWSMLKKVNGGAIATIGATRVAFTHVDETGAHGGAGYLNVHFFEGYEPGTTVAAMFRHAQNDYLNYVEKDYLTIEEFILLGDPSLKVGGYP